MFLHYIGPEISIAWRLEKLCSCLCSWVVTVYPIHKGKEWLFKHGYELAQGPGAFGGLGGLPPIGMGLTDQSATSLFNSPIMQQVMDNPELIRTLLQSNPTIRQVQPDTLQLPDASGKRIKNYMLGEGLCGY